MRNKHLDLHQRVLNAAASQEVENVKAQHTYYHGRADAYGEWHNIWSRDPWCSWGHIFGRMRGWDQIWEGSVTHYDNMAMNLHLKIQKIYPEIGGLDPRPLMEASVHTLFTDIIEVADDGKSARGSFITPGVIFCRLNRHQYPYCNVLWERYGSDFVLENGKWKYLHEQVCPDIMGKLDMTNFAHDDFERLTAPQEAGIGPVTLGEDPDVTDPGPLHLPYSVVMPPQNTVPWPEPYKTLDNDNSFCPVKTFAELQAEKQA